MVEYRFRISGVHYAANPEAEAGMPDTEEMHVRTREMLSCPDPGHPHPLSPEQRRLDTVSRDSGVVAMIIR